MLALLTLKKLIKLEFLALAEYWSTVVPTEVKSFVSYDADCHLVACERAFYRHFFTSCQFAINEDDLCFTYTCLDSIFRESIADVLTRCLDDSFPSYTQYLTVPNPNRFVKSSFALSLLWVAKYYSFLGQDFYNSVDQWVVNASSSAEYKQWSSFTKRFYAAYHAFKNVFDPLGAYPCLSQFMPKTYDFMIDG